MSKIKKILLLPFYKIAPIKRTRFVFTSYNGHYSDSPKCICDAIHAIAPDLELVWLTDKKNRYKVPPWIKWVEIGSFRAEWMKGSAKALIDNVYCGIGHTVFNIKWFTWLTNILLYEMRNKHGQYAYTTWHGAPLKKIGRDQIGNSVSNFICPPITMFLSNNYCAKILQHVTFFHIKTICLGTPRNDILFKPELMGGIQRKLNLPENKKIILFAPTFRNDGKDTSGKNLFRSGIDQLEQMNFSLLFETLSARFGGDWAMVCRFHYHVAEMVNWDKLNAQFPGRIINGNAHDDVSEYLLCADVLLTDASSCMFDYSLTRKPVFLFFPDLDHYERQERGFYLPLSDLPFPVSKSFDGLLQNIQSFEEEEYKENVQKMLDKFGDVDDGAASERIARYILDECGYLSKEKTATCYST